MIYAVDFDGTLCKNAWPEIGEPNTPLIEFLKREQAEGDELILWTMREGGALDEALAWCAKNGLTFDAVNDNAESQKKLYGNNPRKVYADLYIDDHNSRTHPFDNPAAWCWYSMAAKAQRAAEGVGPYEKTEARREHGD